MIYASGTLAALTSALNDAIVELSAPVAMADGTLSSATSQLNELLIWSGSALSPADGSLAHGTTTYNAFVDEQGGPVWPRWRGYFGMEDLGMSDPERAALLAALRALGPTEHAKPSHLCHWCTRLDQKAAIFEAWFNENNMTVNKFKGWLAQIYGVSAGDIDHVGSQDSFAGHTTQIITFSYGAPRLRVAVFGGVSSDYAVSHDEVLGYLDANSEDWRET